MSHFLAFNLVQYFLKKRQKDNILFQNNTNPQILETVNTLSVRLVFLSCTCCCLNVSMKCSEDCIKKMTNTPNAGGEETR